MTDNELKLEETMPTLTLTPDLEAEAAPAQEEAPAVEPVFLDESAYTEAERKVIQDFSEKIDISNATMVLQYGSAAQKKLSDFSESALSNVRTKDLGEVGDLVTDLVGELKGFDVDEDEGGIRGFFKKSANKITNLKSRYDKAEVNVNKICGVLENHQVQLLKDIAMLDRLYDQNLTYFKELSMYIAAGKKRLEDFRANEMKAAYDKANASGLPEDAQAAKDLADQCDRFEKKLHDLKLTRQVALQMAPQIRMLQNNNALLVERIQSTLVNTLPLWKNQMVLAIGLHHSQQAMKAQRAVTDATNELLKKNAETLKMGTLETAKEAERGIIDLETLTKTNQDLIDTITEVQRIQKEGRDKRREAEKRLAEMEDELKKKMLES